LFLDKLFVSSFYFFWFVFFEGKILCHHFFVNLDKVFVIIFFWVPSLNLFLQMSTYSKLNYHTCWKRDPTQQKSTLNFFYGLKTWYGFLDLLILLWIIKCFLI
jgi:hypothetical protein